MRHVARAETVGGGVALADLAVLQEHHAAFGQDADPDAATIGEDAAAMVDADIAPQDFVDAAKAKPGTLTIGTAGVGTGQHMGMELFAAATGIKVLHVPFRGDSAAVTGLLGKTVDAIVTPGTVVFGNIQGGNFRALAITSSERWPALKDVPTVAETVSPGFEMIAWIGVGTTHGVPKPIIERLNQDIRAAIALPSVQEQLRNLGGFPKSSTPEEATERVKKEIPLWKDLAEKAGITLATPAVRLSGIAAIGWASPADAATIAGCPTSNVIAAPGLEMFDTLSVESRPSHSRVCGDDWLDSTRPAVWPNRSLPSPVLTFSSRSRCPSAWSSAH